MIHTPFTATQWRFSYHCSRYRHSNDRLSNADTKRASPGSRLTKQTFQNKLFNFLSTFVYRGTGDWKEYPTQNNFEQPQEVFINQFLKERERNLERFANFWFACTNSSRRTFTRPADTQIGLDKTGSRPFGQKVSLCVGGFG